MAILTVTLNPAWDVTYQVDRLEQGDTHRVVPMSLLPGGKGLNVSGVLTVMGVASLATGLAAGNDAAEFTGALAVPSAFYACPAGNLGVRRTVSVVEQGAGRATMLCEPGPTAGIDWPAVRAHVTSLLDECEVVVLCGSLPPALPVTAYAELVAYAASRGVRTVVDASGPALMAAAAEGADVVKPNLDELRSATGTDDLELGAMRLLDAGARRVVVSAGAEGLRGFDDGSHWQATVPELTPVNATGAGDAACAALAVGVAQGEDWPELLRRAIAWSAAAVLHPVAGTLDPTVAARLDGVAVERLRPPAARARLG